jgi:diguanylate cyclase (GGDEF)-like protein/PAS domain S-box-containing protein
MCAEDVVCLLTNGAHDFLNKNSLARLVPAIERELREVTNRRLRQNAEERVRLLSLAVEQSPASVVIARRDGNITYVNPKFEAVSGYSPNEAHSRDLTFLFAAQTSDQVLRALWATLAEGQEWRGELCNQRKDGQRYWEVASIAPLKDQNGTITHFVMVNEDITERRSYEERLLRQATYDDLTDLPNRALMRDRLGQGIALAKRHGRVTALLHIDLDRFKAVNDSFGHTAGDDVLRMAATRLLGCVHEGDTVARVGGDEFAIILPAISSSRAAVKVAQRVIEAFAQPFRGEDHEAFVTASIGITIAPSDGDTPLMLLRNADLALDQAKEQGRNRFCFFTAEINHKVQARLLTENTLRGAIERDELLLNYQPIVDLRTGKTVALEALVRWRRPDDAAHLPGLQQPGQFISVAEDTGLIVPIGEWVLATACAQMQGLDAITAHPLRMAVNVSPRQLREGTLGETIKRILAQTDLAPERLELEITEGILIDDTSESRRTLQRLCDAGVRLSIDDFGTGYSALGYLRRYPFHTLKIDRSFIADVVDNTSTTRLVETIIAMAHGLNLQVIAEGVETAAQLSLIRDRDCDLAQGYYLGYPVDFATLSRHLLHEAATGRRPERPQATNP